MNNNHEKFKKAMKTAGLILLAVGIVFIVIGAVDFAQAFKSENRPEKFWAFFVGFPLFAVGAIAYFEIELHWRYFAGTLPVHWTMPILGGVLFLLLGHFQFVFNDRWGQVPFYFKTGKALDDKRTTVEIV